MLLFLYQNFARLVYLCRDYSQSIQTQGERWREWLRKGCSLTKSDVTFKEKQYTAFEKAFLTHYAWLVSHPTYHIWKETRQFPTERGKNQKPIKGKEFSVQAPYRACLRVCLCVYGVISPTIPCCIHPWKPFWAPKTFSKTANASFYLANRWDLIGHHLISGNASIANQKCHQLWLLLLLNRKLSNKENCKFRIYSL